MDIYITGGWRFDWHKFEWNPVLGFSHFAEELLDSIGVGQFLKVWSFFSIRVHQIAFRSSAVLVMDQKTMFQEPALSIIRASVK
jgi:hypothetical protein